jgi:hypothetical protein
MDLIIDNAHRVLNFCRNNRSVTRDTVNAAFPEVGHCGINYLIDNRYIFIGDDVLYQAGIAMSTNTYTLVNAPHDNLPNWKVKLCASNWEKDEVDNLVNFIYSLVNFFDNGKIISLFSETNSHYFFENKTQNSNKFLLSISGHNHLLDFLTYIELHVRTVNLNKRYMKKEEILQTIDVDVTTITYLLTENDTVFEQKYPRFYI